MADKIIFEGDINFYVDFEIPSGTEGLATIDDETAANNVRQLADGTEVICEFTSSGNFLSGIFKKRIADEGSMHSLVFKTPITWPYPVSSDNVFMHASNNQIDLYSPISSLPVGEYHLKIYISGPRPKPVTYSASQNGGSIYDNLVELYNSVAGEDPKGHNPSEVIDELKGKLGGGSAGGGVTTYWALINTPNSVYGSGDNISKAYQIWEFDPEKPIDMVTNPKGITDSEINESFLNGTVIVKCIDYSVYASKQKIAVGNIVKLASKFEDYDLTGEPTGANTYIGLMYDRTSSTLVTKYFMRSASSETEANA